MKKRKWVLLAVVLLLLFLYSCVGRGGGMRGRKVSVTDETGSYEVVYAKGVSEITMTKRKNVLTVCDDENLRYEFSKIDSTLEKMEPGDVFYGFLPGSESDCVVVKVDQIHIDDDTAVIQGAEPTMEDLFDSIHIDAEIPAEDVVVLELAEGVRMEEVRIEASDAQTSETASEGASAQKLSALPGSPAVQKLSASVDGPSAQTLSKKSDERAKFTKGKRFYYDVEVHEGPIYLKGSISETVEDVLISIDFDGGESPVTSVAAVRATTEIGIEVDVAQIWYKDIPLASLSVPTPIPLVSVTMDLSATGEIRGSVGGKFAYKQTTVTGAELAAAEGDAAHAQEIRDNAKPTVTADFAQFSGEVKVGPRFAVGLSLAKRIVRFEFAFWTGFRAEAESAPYEPWNEFADSCHDCSICYSGEICVFGEFSLNGYLGWPSSAPPVWSGTLYGMEDPVDHFYISLGPDGKLAPRFGMGECPYRRYRTVVQVLNDLGGVEGAKVTAIYPDQRRDEQWTDASGFAVFWLPDGKNYLDAEYYEQLNATSHTVNAAPGEAKIHLDFSQRLIFICNFSVADYSADENIVTAVWPDYFPEITGELRARYPQAEFFTPEELGLEWRDLSDAGNTMPSTVKENLELKPGDVAVILSAGYSKNQTSEGITYEGYTSFDSRTYLALDGRIGKIHEMDNFGFHTEGRTEYLFAENNVTVEGFEDYLTKVYFYGGEGGSLPAYTEQFKEIAYADRTEIGGGANGETVHWEGDTLLGKGRVIGPAMFDIVYDERTHYYEQNYASYGRALIQFCIDYLTPPIDEVLLEQ